MRVHFDLPQFSEFEINVDGTKYGFGSLNPLAQKRRLATNISEYIYQLPTKEYIYLTVVGDEDQTSALGIHRGWYVVEKISENDAAFAIDAMKKFTDLYRR